MLCWLIAIILGRQAQAPQESAYHHMETHSFIHKEHRFFLGACSFDVYIEENLMLCHQMHALEVSRSHRQQNR